jgi:uridine kinase
MSESQLVQVLELIEDCGPAQAANSTRQHLLTVGIGGHGGTGKSTLARAIAEARADVQVLSTDSFWNGTQFDLNRLRTAVFDELLAGRSAVFDSWDWPTKRLSKRQVDPVGLIIVEGVCALHEMFRYDLDVRIWVEAPYDLRLARGVARDGEAMRSTWTDVWMPSEEAYVARDNPRSVAHFVFDGTSA